MAAEEKIGLAISGGGARGAAAIGVLRVLERAGICPDCVAGTSAGAIGGALYCCGYSADKLADIYCSQNWSRLIRRRSFTDVFDNLTGNSKSIDFDTLPIPFRCVATRLSDYSEQVLSKGRLSECVAASAAMPVLFPPVTIGGERLADGGMVNNLPTDVVARMGATVIIAIDLQQITFWQTRFSLKDTIGIGGILHWAVSHPEVQRYRRNIRSADIYIKPPLRAIDGYLFSNSRCRRMVEIGERL